MVLKDLVYRCSRVTIFKRTRLLRSYCLFINTIIYGIQICSFLCRREFYNSIIRKVTEITANFIYADACKTVHAERSSEKLENIFLVTKISAPDRLFTLFFYVPVVAF